MLKSRKGFTLIELLVVVAIIGILASIVLVSLNSARAKGRDASAKGSMSSMRATSELYFDNWNDYGSGSAPGIGSAVSVSTGTGTTLGNALSICEYDQIIDLGIAVNNQTNQNVNCQVIASPASYTFWVELNDGRTYCVDSAGFAGPLDNTGALTAPNILGGRCLP